jgi:hypothetical protein
MQERERDHKTIFPVGYFEGRRRAYGSFFHSNVEEYFSDMTMHKWEKGTPTFRGKVLSSYSTSAMF